MAVSQDWGCRWIQKGDKFFNGGVSVYNEYGNYVSGAYLGTRNSTNPAGKIYNQCYRWSADYIRWREGPTATVAPKCLSVTPASASVPVNKPSL
jgi:hypothetical protein